MIEKGNYNVYDNAGNDRHIKAIRNNIKTLYSICAETVRYLAIDVDTQKDPTFGEDNFPNVVAMYEGVKVRTSDGKPLNIQSSVSNWGYVMQNTKTIFINCDHFHDLTKKANEDIPELTGRSWMPQVGDVIISDMYNQNFQISEVNTTEAVQRLGDRNSFTVTIVPYTSKNMNYSNIDITMDDVDNNINVRRALDSIFGTTHVSNSTGSVEDIDVFENEQNVKKEIYSLNEDGEIILDKSRDEILGEF